MSEPRQRLLEQILDELPVWQRSVVLARITKVLQGYDVSFSFSNTTTNKEENESHNQNR